MPEAKLLSGKECGEFAAIQIRPIVRTTLPLGLNITARAFVLLAGPRVWSGWYAFGAAPVVLRRAPQSDLRLTFFIRPPPFIH